MFIVIPISCSAPRMQKGQKAPPEPEERPSCCMATSCTSHTFCHQIMWHMEVLSKDRGHHPPKVQNRDFTALLSFQKQSWVMTNQGSKYTESQAGNDSRGYSRGFRESQVSEMSHWPCKAAQSTHKPIVQYTHAEIQQRNQHKNLY